MLITSYKEGDSFIYQGQSFTISKYIFSVKEIKESDKAILLSLSDNTGSTLTANFWKNSTNPNMYIDENGNYKLVEISEGDTIEAIGFEYMYSGFRQFNPIGGYKLVENVQIEYKPNIDTNVYLDKIIDLINKIESEPLKLTCRQLLFEHDDDLVMRPAASKHHHNYVGGLVQHTYEVMIAAYNLSNNIVANKDYILVAALYHDIMKIKEYTNDGRWLPYGEKIGHVVGSCIEFLDTAKACGVDENTRNEIAHIILSHHGKKEWGSPVEPKTIEAVIVHEADMVSSYINPIALSENKGKDYYNK